MFATASTNGMTTSDEEWMHRYQQGDADAFHALYYRYKDRLHRYLLRLASRPADAEELFQDVWAAVIKGRNDFRRQASFAGWLFAIAHRRAADRWRSLERHVPDWRTSDDDVASQAWDGEAPAALSPDHHAHGEALGKALLEAVNALPLPQREAFLLRAEGELTLDDMATITGVSRETVKSRLRYAQAKLRSALEAWQ